MNYYNEIKETLINNENYKKIKDYSKNRSDLETYYNVGKLLAEAGKHYGEGIVKEYSKRLTNELGKGYTFTALTRMRQFYFLKEKVATLSQQLSLSHYLELLSIKDINKIKYYMNISIEQNLAVRKLREKIKLNEYERLDEKTKIKLMNNEVSKIEDFIKNPIVLNNSHNYGIITEKTLQNIILENMIKFLKELGSGFSFIENEYKIKLGDRYNYIDLLLYNYIYNCFVVIELKITELKKEHIGQIKAYMNYIDKNIKRIDQDKTIGIIICKKDNKFVMDYTSDERVYRTTYIFN